MWATAKLRADITDSATVIRFADNVGFEQCLVGDLIVVDQVRDPEQMRVTGFDEAAKTVTVTRAVHNTRPAAHKRGAGLKIFRIVGGVAEISSLTEDVEQVDGTVEKGVLVSTNLSYGWAPEDVCVPGCFWFEFKVLKLLPADGNDVALSGSAGVTSSGFVSYRCALPDGVEWVRRFPADGAFLIRIADSPTSENLA